jgi:hypothetical protein
MKKASKLNIRRETLHNLEAALLDRVQGGTMVTGSTHDTAGNPNSSAGSSFCSRSL